MKKANNTDKLLSDDLDRANMIALSCLDNSIDLIDKISKNLGIKKGKQLRMRLAILSAYIFDVDGVSVCGAQSKQDEDIQSIKNKKRYLNLAAAVELIHSATLLHDDVVDDATVRRGKTASHTVWGRKTAILAGDFLFAKAFQLMVDSGSLAALDCLASASSDIVAGEIQQMQMIRNLDATMDSYLDIIDGKTAKLFAASLRGSAYLRDIDESDQLRDQDTLHRFGISFGRLFQMIDDLLDYTQPESGSGKVRMKDLEENLMTFPLLVALRGGPDLRTIIIKELKQIFASEVTLATKEKMYKILHEAGIFVSCMEIIKEEYKVAKKLCLAMPSNDYRDKLLEILNGYIAKAEASSSAP